MTMDDDDDENGSEENVVLKVSSQPFLSLSFSCYFVHTFVALVQLVR